MDHRIDPQLRAILPALPQVDISDPAACREAQRLRGLQAAAAAGPLQGVTVDDRVVPGAEGQPDVPVRIYRPEGSSGVLGVLVWFHGGGYVFGDIASSDRSCADLATKVGCLVVSVEYRLAPEHPYPAALDDARAALAWVAAEGVDIGADPARIAVGGVSAGAGLAAALALYNRDHAGPELVLQVLDNPMLDDRVATQSATEFTDTPLWTGPQAVLGWRFYLGETPGEVSPYAAAARAEDLRGLPAAYVAANEFDPLRDEDLDYAVRLIRAGVPVELHHLPGTFHGSNALPGAEVAERARGAMYGALARVLG